MKLNPQCNKSMLCQNIIPNSRTVEKQLLQNEPNLFY